jgi:uncharacterized repeat protein (TIGR01451 family)
MISGWRHRPGSWLRTVTAQSILLGATATGASGQPTPAGTRIDNWAEVTFESSDGQVYSVLSDTLAIVVGQVAGVDVEPPRSAVVDPGTEVVFPHTLTNIGNGPDSFVVAATSVEGWPVRAHRDTDGDGVLGAGDPLITGPISLAISETAALLAVVSVPGGAQVRGTIDTIRVEASSLFDGSVADAVADILEVRVVGIVVNLIKSVDRASATIGDILTYTIRYETSGSGSATSFEIVDAVPAATSYLPGTLRLDGAALTDAAGDDAGFFDVAGNRVVFAIGDLSGGDAGTVSFQVRVDG